MVIIPNTYWYKNKKLIVLNNALNVFESMMEAIITYIQNELNLWEYIQRTLFDISNNFLIKQRINS